MPLSYDEAREKYRPAKIRCLFIGESRPAGGTFFFNENSNLYFATKEAFQRTMGTSFDCKLFQEFGCWLYDVCDVPVNHLIHAERIALIQRGIPALRETLQKLKPKCVIVVKKGDFGKTVYPYVLDSGYIDGQTSCLLPFPLYQYREQYISELAALLKKCLNGKED